ncbi:hypothetical protein BDN72DRAFT_879029 [Pluteus cervinus]|uniref:Uncharacterized protein n=1 Tax=Pluteus cervinus TaxID=181527 RepID=A0ACD3ARZ6_9AGAR|nr:hypothetical protein BDN72DRAFT_879029 [Pluteus cervinus]
MATTAVAAPRLPRPPLFVELSAGYHPRIGPAYYPMLLYRKVVISLLPDNILVDIFRRACANPGGDTVGLYAAPWSISHVCQAWRNLALRDPNLWVAIVLDRSKTFGATMQNTKGYATRIGCIIERSGKGPLFIDFKEGHSQEGCEILFKLSASSRRWQAVRFSLRLNTVFQGLQRVYGQIPNLQSLQIEILGSQNEAVNCFLPLTAFLVAPALRSITKIKSCIEIQLPWHQIEEYCGSSECSLRDDLIQGPNLKTYRLRSPAAAARRVLPDLLRPNQIFQHEHLVTLELDYLQDFALIQLPALKHLAITRDNGNIYWLLNDIILRLGCTLETFCGPSNDFTLEDDFRKFLQACPQLRALQLVFPKVAWSDSDGVLKALTHPDYSSAGTYLAPNLTELTLAFMPVERSPDAHFKEGLLFHMLLSRSSHRLSRSRAGPDIRPLKKVLLSIPDFLIPRLPLHCVGQLEGAGMEVIYRTWTRRINHTPA